MLGMPYMHRCSSFCLIVFALLLSHHAHAETWMEVTSPHFRVITDGSVSQGRDVARDFEQMRHVFAVQLNDPEIGAHVPLTILAASDEGTFKMLEPRTWKQTGGNLAGEFHHGWEKQFASVILSANVQGQVVVLHEYTHSVLHARAHWLPMWLDEGMAEFYGYTRFETARTLVGTPSQRMGMLHDASLIPVAEMLNPKDQARLLQDQRRANLFYAEAWAMVHYMEFGKDMQGGIKLNAFFAKLQGGEPQATAFSEVFGDTKAFDDALSQYVRAITFKAGVMPADPKIDSKTFAVRKLTLAEVEYELGSFQVGAREMQLGRVRIEKALALDPKLAGAHEELAFLLFHEGKDSEAIKEWQQAVELDPARARSVFALLMTGVPLRDQKPQQLLETQRALQHVLELTPGFAPAHVELGLVDWRLGRLQQAYNDVHKAETLEPWRAGYHVLGGRILLAGHQPALAAKSARYVAERWEGPDRNEAVDLWQSVPVAARGDGAPPLPDMPPGAAVQQGSLTELTCGTSPGAPTLITLQPDTPGAAPITFKAERFRVGFSDSFWWGEDHFSPCHHLAGHTAVIAYKPADKVLLDLEVRDDLPTPATQGASAPAALAATP